MRNPGLRPGATRVRVVSECACEQTVEAGLKIGKKNHEWSDRETSQEFQLLVVQLLRYNLSLRTKATSFTATLRRTCNLFLGQTHSRILRCPRIVVLFFALLVGCEEWFYIPAGSLLYVRRVISCILFSLEQSRLFNGC